MSEDDVNKIETLVGYLQPLYDAVEKKSGWMFLPDVIEEAEDWVSELRLQANTKLSRELAQSEPTNPKDS